MRELARELVGKGLMFDRSSDGCRVVAASTDVLAWPGLFERVLGEVSEYRRRKALGFSFERDQRLSLLAGLLLDELLVDFGLRERSMTIRENEFGKPSFSNRPDLLFSLSHSGNMAVAALATHLVGVDVEDLATFSYDIAEPFKWTTMESVGKALGVGVGAYVDSGEFSIPDDFEVEHVLLDGVAGAAVSEVPGLPGQRDSEKSNLGDTVNGRYLVCIAQRLPKQLQ